ncbi:hypothetical protein M885DRAFT_532803 [Pelagophyceae sp. CCMP2097]|nr:hypothetical protein M885DRAFT_532803 [Pelagophyceae sp. CCMP2097]
MARSRLAAHSATTVALAAQDEASSNQRSLGELGLISASAAKAELDASMSEVAEITKLLKNENHDVLEEEQRKKKESLRAIEKLEEAAARVLAAELAISRRLASARADFAFAARHGVRRAAEELSGILLSGSAGAAGARTPYPGDAPSSTVDNRPHIIDALLSGDAVEIEAAFSVLTAPLVLGLRHLVNAAQLFPRVVLVVIGIGVVIDGQFNLSTGCAGVIVIHGHPFLPLSGWLVTQLLTDSLIVLLRMNRYFLLKSVVAEFSRGEGMEATTLRHRARAELFSSFLRSKIARAMRRPGSRGRSAPPARGAVRARGNSVDGPNQGHPRGRDAGAPEKHDDRMDVPYALDVVIPIEQASERGEHAMRSLSAIEESWTRQPLAFLTILSFFLGLAGAIYSLLPNANSTCSPRLVVVVHAYVVFFFVFLIPNVGIVYVASLETCCGSARGVLGAAKKFDDVFFLGKLPLFSFVAKRLLSKATAPVSQKRLEQMLRRDEYVLDRRRAELREALADCEAQCLANQRLKRSVHLEGARAKSPRAAATRAEAAAAADAAPDAPHSSRRELMLARRASVAALFKLPEIKAPRKPRRYVRRVPQITWKKSYVPLNYDDYDENADVKARGAFGALPKAFWRDEEKKMPEPRQPHAWSRFYGAPRDAERPGRQPNAPKEDDFFDTL